MLEKLIYANLGYESNSINIILEANKKLENLNLEVNKDLKDIEKSIEKEANTIKAAKANIIKESELSETEVNKFFEENEILSTSSNNGLNAVIFRNKTTNKIEISVGGTEDAYDYINNVSLIITGYPFSQGIELKKQNKKV